MLRAITSFCIKERLIMVCLTVLVIAGGWYSFQNVPIDAIPNIGQNQVIVYTSWPGRSPKDIEDQITYPLSVALLSVPEAESVRGKSLFGYSFVQVTFKDSTDFYWARSRVSEQLGSATSTLPAGVTPTLGPDATGLGQVMYYILEPSKDTNLADLRSLQDYVVKFELEAVDGVSEVASIGGYVREYQIEVDPDKLRFHHISLNQVMAAIKESNQDVGAKTVESSGMEMIIRSRGFIGTDQDVEQAIIDIEQTVIRSENGLPTRIRDIATVQIGPSFRRGALDVNGIEAVGGIVTMQYGNNPRAVIDEVKKKIAQIEPSLDGVQINVIYDRSGLINETITTLTTVLKEEVIITAIVILLFLLNLRASIVVAITLPIAVLIAFIGMYVFNIDANIMSLAGIAIAIGTMVDMSIIVSEVIYSHLAEWEEKGRPGGKSARLNIIIDATIEVSPAIVTAVMTTVISFLPIFLLTGRDYKLFAPLAWTKTFSLIAALIVAVTIVPLLSRMMLSSSQIKAKLRWIATGLCGTTIGLVTYRFGESFPAIIPGPRAFSAVAIGLGAAAIVYWLLIEKLRPIQKNPISRIILFFYEPTLRFFLAHKFLFLTIPIVIMGLGYGAWKGVDEHFEALEKGVDTFGVKLQQLPGYDKTREMMKAIKSDDWIALDEGSWFYMPTLYPAASLSQAMEVLQTQDTLIKQIPEVENVLGKIGRAESALDPAPTAMIETYVMLKPKDQWRAGITSKDIWQEINQVATLPGVTPASELQPIQGRVVMLQSGITATMAIRIYGDNLTQLSEAALDIAAFLKDVPEINPATISPDIVLGKPYVEFDVNRDTAARFGMSTMMVNQVISAALGGTTITQTVEGRERYAIRVRYQRNLREQMDEYSRLPVVTKSGETVPLANLATMQTTWGPGGISSENARLVAHVSFSPTGVLGDVETARAVEDQLRAAQKAQKLIIPPGYSFKAVGSFQNQVEANNRLLWALPIVVIVNLFIIYLQFRHIPISLAVFSGIPVAFAGGMLALAFNSIEINTAVWVGFIALFGIAVDDGIVMATYLNQIFTRKKLTSAQDIRDATAEAGMRRIRPCLMTTFTTIIALIPVVISTGRGADVASAMAWPVIGGMTIELLTLFMVPVVYSGYKELKMNLGLKDRHWEAGSF
ncbi:MAG: efflux RND transporter permease subunit [Planctomycetaceae bacterium]|nr:efflux RND transporter permease subunit [Planctomycetaceae bacterium]MBT4845748.1 efflux RND transporter permease subunit [Planctomycetaceae bacterium]MBT5598611.1 efflux RND transporter permease subunit [Planctomycetaceae bacterium]MBT7918788.1 efflux RND transporter permease subunit [Planctomycetaceae bacterium]